MEQYNKDLLNDTCPFCLNKAITTNFVNVLKCKKCQILFQNRDSINKNIADIYNIDYFQWKVYKNYFDEEEERKQRFRKKLKLITSYIPQEGRVLDVGCASGFFLKVMKEIGYKTYGLDVSSAAYEYAKNHYNINIFKGEISKAKYKENFFDIITLWDVLEHLIDPESVLKEIYRITKSHGILLIETLNIDSWNFKILQTRWPLFFPDYHLFYYNKNFLIKLLNKIGFKVRKIIPVQTYLCLKNYKLTLRYFNQPILGKIMGHFFDDVILMVVGK